VGAGSGIGVSFQCRIAMSKRSRKPVQRSSKFAPSRVDAAGAACEARPRRQYSRWRVASLIGVHVLVAVHIAHWRFAGKTLAPLEFNEAMYTLELGLVTAGFVLMALVVVSTAIFGRFFCSWCCHILALQDLCAWMLRKLRIRPKPVRSRVLLLVAPGALFYLFLWPQIQRFMAGYEFPGLHLRDNATGWASFVTDDFWRNLPGPWIAGLTFAICGFAIVYLLGTRSFCRYACPYGALFGIADRVAPGRIKADPDQCTACGICTSVCSSHVRVHEEIAQHGKIVDPACLKDLDCVSACPENALSYGWTRSSLLRSFRPARRRLRYDFTAAEDALMVAVFLGALAVFRGLYGVVPFLLTLAIGGILAYFAALCLRLVRSRSVRVNNFRLKSGGHVTRSGRVFAVVGVLVWAFVLHSGVIRYHELQGQSALARAEASYRGGAGAGEERVEQAAREALDYLLFCQRWGLVLAPGHYVRVASAYWGAGNVKGAEAAWTAAIRRNPEHHDSRINLAISYLQRERADLAAPLLREVTRARERSAREAARYARDRATAWQLLGNLAMRRGDTKEARKAYAAVAREREALEALRDTVRPTR